MWEKHLGHKGSCDEMMLVICEKWMVSRIQIKKCILYVCGMVGIKAVARNWVPSIEM